MTIYKWKEKVNRIVGNSAWKYWPSLLEFYYVQSCQPPQDFFFPLEFFSKLAVTLQLQLLSKRITGKKIKWWSHCIIRGARGEMGRLLCHFLRDCFNEQWKMTSYFPFSLWYVTKIWSFILHSKWAPGTTFTPLWSFSWGSARGTWTK